MTKFMSTMTSSSPLLFLLLFVVVVVSSGPIVTPEQEARDQLIHDIIWGINFGCTVIHDAVPHLDGFKTLRAILIRYSIKPFIWADKLPNSITYENSTSFENKVAYYEPICALHAKMYIKRLENEKKLMDEDSGLFDDLIYGRRPVKRLRKKMFWFDGSLNLNVTETHFYDSWNFGVYEVHGFGSLKYTKLKSFNASYKNKIEFVIVTKIVASGDELKRLRRFIGRDLNGLQNSNEAVWEVPLTMLYTVYF